MRQASGMGTGRQWACAFGLSVAALVAGCGGGGGGGTAAAVAPPVPESPASPAGGNSGEPRSALIVLAGTAGGPGLVDGQGAAARLSMGSDSGLAVAADGTVYIGANTLIRRISPAGVVSTWASGFNAVAGMALDAAGNLFVADSGNQRIARVSAAGVVSTFAGSGVEGSADGAAGVAQFSFPVGVAVDAAGNVYVADLGNELIRKVSPAGAVKTLAGQPGFGNRGYQDGPGAQARFNSPGQLALDASGNLLVADQDNDAVRTVDAAGNVGTLARVTAPGGLAVRNASVYISTNHTVIRITAGVSTLVAGLADTDRGAKPASNGTGGEARFSAPGALGLDPAGTLYVGDGATVRKVTPDAVVSTLAGAFDVFPGSADGAAAAARFSDPDSVALDGSGTVYVSDYNNHTVRRIAGGVVSTLAGVPGVSSRTSGAPSNSLDFPSGLASDSAGNLDVVESWGVSLRRISPSGVLGASRPTGAPRRSLAGSPLIGRGSVARDSSGNDYITDTLNNTVYRMDAAGNASLLAGLVPPDPQIDAGGTADGAGTAARFRQPNGVAVDAAGTIYIADSGNNTIRRMTPAGVVSTWAGLAGTAGDTDGPVAAARFNNPVGLAFDTAGNLYVTDQDNSLVRKISPAGVVSTVAGQRGKFGVVAGPLPATLGRPAGIVAGPAGELYVTDVATNVLLKITPP
jgi:sugar lactone lactonase YvrE